MKLKSIVVAATLIAIAAGGWKWNESRALAESKSLKAKAEADLKTTIERQIKSLSEEAINLPRTGEQGNLISNALPILPWRKLYPKLDKEPLHKLSTDAKNIVMGALKDPDSAKFKEPKILAVVDSRGYRYFICGLVNSKNSFGGYVGFAPYIFEIEPYKSYSLKGGIGDEGSIASVRFDERWWKYDADDACQTEGTPIE